MAQLFSPKGNLSTDPIVFSCYNVETFGLISSENQLSKESSPGYLLLKIIFIQVCLLFQMSSQPDLSIQTLKINPNVIVISSAFDHYYIN